MKAVFVLPVFFLVGALLFSPALTSFFYWDDYPLLCMARYIGHPGFFFIENYFPGGYFYRPLGMLFYWLPYQVSGLNPILHNVINPLFHVLNVLLLLLLLKQLFPQGKATLYVSPFLFLIHPVGVSTSLWQGTRFDLLATMFMLMALSCFLRVLSTAGKRAWLCSVLCTGLGILSKEVAYILPLGMTLLLLAFWNRLRDRSWLKKILLLVPCYGMTLVLYVIRSHVLGVTEGFFFEGVPGPAVEGILNVGAFHADTYFTAFSFPFIGGTVKALFLVWLLVFVVMLFWHVRTKNPVPWSPLLVGLGLIVMAGAIMAPVMGLSLFVRPEEGFSFFLIAQGRFYYLPLVGFLILLTASLVLITDFLQRCRSPRTLFVPMVLLFSILSFYYGLSSFSLSREWRALTNGKDRELAEAADEASRLCSRIEPGSKIYFFGTENHTVFFREFRDAI